MATYRVIFKKNLGNGKRTRVNMTANSLTELSDAITDKAHDDRMRPMRVQEMNGSTVIAKFKINTIDDEYDIVKAKERSEFHETTMAVPVNTSPTVKPKKALTAKQVALADIEDEGLVFDLDQ